MSVRSGLCLPILAALLGLAPLVGCRVPDKTVMLHSIPSEGARALWQVAFVREFTIPENYRFQTEEYSSVAADPARGLVYIGSRDGTLVALDDRQGEVMWEMDLGGGISSVPLLVVIEPAAEPAEGEPKPEDGKQPIRARASVAGERADWMLLGTDDGTLVALDLETRKVLWRHTTSGVVRNPPVLGEGVVYFVNSRDEILAVDLREGEWVWEHAGKFQKNFTVYGRAGLAYLPPSEAGDAGVIYTGLADGRVIALAASSGATLWSEPLAPAGSELFVDVDTTPLLVPERGEMIVANQNTGVFSLGLDDGAHRWNTEIRAVGSLVAGPGGMIIAASSLEGLHGLEFDGRIRWRQQLDPGGIAAPLVVGDIAYVGHSDVGLLAYASEDGLLLGRLDNGSGSSGQPVFDPVLGRVYATSDRGQLYALVLSVD
ncbi:PQQ-binding-like beta-propeller repeat protein [Nannocystaceae bacterium ST9]